MKVEIERGTLIKIANGEHWDEWATVIKKNNDILNVVFEKTKKTITVSIRDIKSVIGTIKKDYLGLGKQRHNNEIKKEIIRVLRLFPAE